MRARIHRKQPLGGNKEPDDRQRARHIVAAVERRHRIFGFLAFDHHHPDDGRKQSESTRDQREHDAFQPEVWEQADTENHRTDVFRGRRFEQIGATTGAVAHVIADEICDHGGVARVVFRNSGFDLADQISSDIRRLRVDSTAKLREQSHEGSAEAVADDSERNPLRIVSERFQERVQPTDAQQTHGDDEQARYRAAAERNLQALIEAGAHGGGGTNIGTNRNPQADVTGHYGAGRPEYERKSCPKSQLNRWHRVGGTGSANKSVKDKYQRGEHRRETDDRAILAR